jgi:hypothetical protein
MSFKTARPPIGGLAWEEEKKRGVRGEKLLFIVDVIILELGFARCKLVYNGFVHFHTRASGLILGSSSSNMVHR